MNLPAWTPLERAHMPDMSEGELLEHAEKIALETELPVADVLAHMSDVRSEEVWQNSRYQVNVRRQYSDDGSRQMVHLSIKRLDKQPVGGERYRDFMLIKDTLVGAECEGLEIYPARSREADSANQYHLWCIRDPTWRVPFGFVGRRFVLNGSGKQEPSGSVQSPMEDHHVR